MKDLTKYPIELSSTRAWRTYTGGKLIDEMYSKNSEDTNFPEEWIASCVNARNPGREHIEDEGLSYIKDMDQTLKSLIETYPTEMLGENHHKKHGTSMAVLAKIIDSSERLTIQCHPTKENAKKYFDSEFGKTESWHILGGREINGEKPCIYMGFKEGVTREKFKELFETQDLKEMLDCLHKIEIFEGETYLIKGGMPHAIGSGCFLVEVQEPTDYTIRVEQTTPSGLKITDKLCHQGIGFEKMFDIFDFTNYTYDEILHETQISERISSSDEKFTEYDLINSENTDCFKMRKINIKKEYISKKTENFYVIKVLGGNGKLRYLNKTFDISRGKEFFIPASLGLVKFTGEMELLAYYPPQ